MLQNLFSTWFGSTFLSKIWRVYGKCQKQSPTVTFRHQCCKQIASIVFVFVFCLCVCFCLCQLSERSHVSTIALQLKNFSKQGKCAKVPTMFILIKTRKSGQLLHQSGGQEARGKRQEAGGSPHQMGIHFRLLHSVLVTPQVTMSDDG